MLLISLNQTLTCDVAPRRQILTESCKTKRVYKVSCAKQTRKIWCNNIHALYSYRNYCVGTFYSDLTL